MKEKFPEGQPIPYLDMNKLKEIQKKQAEGQLAMDLSSELMPDSIYREALENDCAPQGVSLSEDSDDEDDNEESESIDARDSKVQVQDSELDIQAY